MGKGRFCCKFAVKTNKIMDLNTVKTVVVKIGTSTLTYENGKMNLSADKVGAQLLIVSQFTLYADCSSRRPGFTKAAGGAVVVLEKNCTPGKLYELIRSLLADEDRRREMSRKLHTMVRLDSAERICDIVEQLTQSEK